MSEFIQLQVSVPSRDVGLSITRAVVGERLAGCAQLLGPIASTYWWDGEVQVDEEFLLLIKTPDRCYPQLEDRVRALHPDEVAEIIAVPVTRGLADYLAWLDAETGAAE